MTRESGDGPETEKQVIIVLDNSSTVSINYEYTELQDIYHISGMTLFNRLIENLINKAEEVKIIYIFHDLEDLLDTCRALHSIEGNRGEYKQRFVEGYKEILRQLSRDHQSTTDMVEPYLAKGQCDRPMSFDLRIVIDTSRLNYNHLSVESIRIQQFARFLALKHGGSLLATQSIALIKGSPTVALQENLEPKAVFSSSPQTSNNELLINLFLPKAWDSWSKIKFLSKAVIDSTGAFILDDEQTFEDFDSLYNDLLMGKISTEEILGQHLKIIAYGNNEEVKKGTKSFEEMLSMIAAQREDANGSKNQLNESMSLDDES